MWSIWTQPMTGHQNRKELCFGGFFVATFNKQRTFLDSHMDYRGPLLQPNRPTLSNGQRQGVIKVREASPRTSSSSPYPPQSLLEQAAGQRRHRAATIVAPFRRHVVGTGYERESSRLLFAHFLVLRGPHPICCLPPPSHPTSLQKLFQLSVPTASRPTNESDTSAVPLTFRTFKKKRGEELPPSLLSKSKHIDIQNTHCISSSEHLCAIIVVSS